MSRLPRRPLGPLAALVAGLFCLFWSTSPLRAVVHLTDDAALARASAAAVRGVVVAVTSRRDPAVDAIYTHVRLRVTRAWGFASPPGVVELKLLGGSDGSTALVVGDQVRFAPGEHVFALLEVRPRDGTLSVTGLERGKWTIDGAGSGGTATQPAGDSDARPVADAVPLRHLDELAALAGTSVRLPANLRASGASTGLDAGDGGAFVATDAPTAIGARWHEADWGAPVFVDSMSSGHPLFPANGFNQLLRGIASWSRVSTLRLLPGVLRGPRCFGSTEAPDGRVSVSYDDPCDEIADSSPTLAIGGAYYSSADVRVVRGASYWKITKGIVVLDNARGKFAAMSTGCYEDVLTHELGHAIGLAHAATTPAMMAPTLAPECVHRSEGLPLQPVDRSALDALYPVLATTDGPPGTPAGLTAVVTGTTVRVSWFPTGAAASSYQLVVGSMPGSADIGQFVLGSASVVASGVGRGVYYARVVAMNAHGVSAASPDVAVVVGDGLPGAPVGLLAGAGQRGDVRLFWQAPRQGAPVASYVLLVGTAADRPTIRIPMAGTALAAQGVASGTYYVRAVAVNEAGAGPASAEILVVVP